MNSTVTIHFGPGSGAFSCNDKVYLQGSLHLLSEPGEWALDSNAGLVYYWPRDSEVMAAGLRVVATTTKRVIDIRGSRYDQAARGLHFDGLTVSGSDFGTEYVLWSPSDVPNSTPLPLREGMVRVENATDIAITRCRLLDAGQSAVWVEGYAINVSVTDTWIERPGFCGIFFNGPVPGETAGGIWKKPDDAYVNRNHTVSNVLIFDYGIRVTARGCGSISRATHKSPTTLCARDRGTPLECTVSASAVSTSHITEHQSISSADSPC